MGFAAKKDAYPPAIASQSAATAEPVNHDRAPTYAAQSVAVGKMFYTVEEAAARLGLRVSWLYERTRRKAIPHRRLGKYVRFTEDDLRAISDAAAAGTLQ